MKPRLRSQRLWQLLERFPRKLLYRIGRAARISVRDGTYKDDLLETLCALPEAALARALAEGLARQDLQALCKRIGYASAGAKTDLAARILAAVDDAAVHAPRWRPFAEARAFARRLELTGLGQWRDFVRGRLPDKGTLPADIPATPSRVYAKVGWKTWGDFLGTGNVASHLIEYRPFRQARAYVRSLGLAGTAEWHALCKARIGNRRVLPPDIPASPYHVYAGRGWVSYGDWLGTGRVHPSNYQPRSYEEARAFVRALGIRSQAEWAAYCRGELGSHGPRPRDIPHNPARIYRGRGWTSWKDFLGPNAIAPHRKAFLSFADARSYMHEQGLRGEQAWRAWRAAGNRPSDIPAAPDAVYRGKGWVSWGDFLGTGNIAPSRVRRRSFAAMRRFARRLGLSAASEYRQAKREGRIPEDIPLTINRHPEWKGWADFLGPSYTGHAWTARTRRRRGRPSSARCSRWLRGSAIQPAQAAENEALECSGSPTS